VTKRRLPFEPTTKEGVCETTTSLNVMLCLETIVTSCIKNDKGTSCVRFVVVQKVYPDTPFINEYVYMKDCDQKVYLICFY